MISRDTKVAVLGDGGWGTTLSLLLAKKGYRVSLWGAFPDYVDEMRRLRENVKFLPGFKIPANVRPETSMPAAIDEAAFVVVAAPTQHLRRVAGRIPDGGLRGRTVVSVAKGIETASLKTPSQIIREFFPAVRPVVLSGPCIAREVAKGTPSAVSLASFDARALKAVHRLFSTASFALFESNDPLGVEIGGAVKNVLAIGSGILEGLGHGSNTRALVFARGVAEMARLGRKMGARRETFMGLSGLGDLATTCLSPHSRNRTLGHGIGKGKKLAVLLGNSEMVVEGVETAKAVHRLARKHKVKLPICEAVHGVLFGRRKPETVLKALMTRAFSRELD